MATRFTNRVGGVSQGRYESLNLALHVGDQAKDVYENRALVSQELGPVQYMRQVHGDRIVVIEGVIEGVIDEDPTADALITGIPGVVLAVQVADCIPLLLTSNEAVAAVHVGRAGLANDISRKTLSVMRQMGARKISAILGPSICGKCYEVSDQIYQEIINLHPAAKSRTVNSTPALDLPAALQAVLASEGVDVATVGACTFENDDLFSYRRDGVTGRTAGLVWI